MPEGLSAELELDISAALARIDEAQAAIAAALEVVLVVDTSAAEAAIAALAAAAVDVPVSADTTQAEAAIGALADAPPIDVPVGADTAGVAEEVQLAFDGLSVTIPIDVESGAAEASLADLGTAADKAADSVDTSADEVTRLTGAEAAFTSASDLATGSVAALGVAVGSMSDEAGHAVGILTALAAAGGFFFTNALQAEASLFRFNRTLGAMADEIENIDVGGLNTTIGELSLLLGSNDEAVRNAASSIVQLGKASGATEDEIAATTEQIIALAANARAANPDLGDLGDIAQVLANRLARGGRFVADFGISLNATDIEARALADTGKHLASELTVYEKSAAGAALATEALGGALATSITEGAANPIITLEALRQRFDEFLETVGQPLVAPVFELLEGLLPVAEEVAAALADLLVELLPLVVELLPLLTSAAKGVGELVDVVAPLLRLLVDIVDPLVDVTSALTDVAGAEDNVAHSSREVSRAIGESGLDRVADFFGWGPEAERAAEAIRAIATASGSFGAAFDLAAGGLSSYSSAAADALAATERLGLLLDSAAALHLAHALAVQEDAKSVGEFFAARLADAEAAAESFADGIISTFPTAAEAIRDVRSAREDLDKAFDPGALAAKLRETAAAIAGEMANLDVILFAQFGNIVAHAEEFSAQEIAAIADGIRSGNTKPVEELNIALGYVDGALAGAADRADEQGSIVATQINDGWAQALDVATPTQEGLDAAEGVISGNTSVSAAAVQLMDNAALAAANTARSGGTTAGGAFGSGMVAGINSFIGAVNAAAANLAGGASTSAFNQLHMASPSRVTFEIGELFGEGLALGIESLIPRVSAASEALTLAAVAPLERSPIASVVSVDAGSGPQLMSLALTIQVDARGTGLDEAGAQRFAGTASKAITDTLARQGLAVGVRAGTRR